MIRITALLILILGVFSVDSFAIIGGERASGAYPQIINLRVYKDAKMVSLCTGTVVGRKTVLTAAHCLVNSRLDVYETDARRVEIDLGHGREPIFAYAIPSVFRGQKKELDFAFSKRDRYSAETLRNFLLSTSKSDLALIYTKEVIPLSLAPLTLGASKSEINSPVEIAGFGEIQENGAIFYPHELYLGRNEVFSHPPGSLILRSSRGAITSTGDSGGPLLNEKQQIIGVLSGGGQYAGTRESFYVEVFSWLTWLNSRIR